MNVKSAHTHKRYSQKHNKGVFYQYGAVTSDNASPPDINVSLSHLHNY